MPEQEVTVIPGPYSICHATLHEDSDAPDFRTLTFGYDTAVKAYAELPAVAKEHDVPVSECCVLRVIEPEEAVDFIR